MAKRAKKTPPTETNSETTSAPLDLFIFLPKMDITTYELAVLLHYIVGREPLTRDKLKALDLAIPGISRHLGVKTVQQNVA